MCKMDLKTKAPKEKRRNNEKRKEKSRDAARSRRSRETEIFNELAGSLPLNSEQVSQLDKASIMRLAIAYLRVRDMVDIVPQPAIKDKANSPTDESVFLKSLEGFVLVLSSEGDFVYLSENVSDYLGITQIDLLGQNVFEYSHPCDHDEIREILSLKTSEDYESPKSMFVRLKCTLTSKGRSVNLKSASYKVIHCTGHLVKSKAKNGEVEKGKMQSCFVAVGQPIPHPSNIDTPLPRQTFLTKHSLDMKFTHADDKFMIDVLGYTPDDLIGKSVYEYHHAMDSDSIGAAYKCLFSKGQCQTNRYRFLVKTGGYVWVVTQATLIYDKMQKPQSVVCVNYVISGVENKNEIYSAHQQQTVKPEPPLVVPDIVIPVVSSTSRTTDGKTVEPPKTRSVTAKLFVSVDETKEDQETGNRPHTTTKKIFAPRTEEMNKGFLTFSEEQPGMTMLKDEPEDLTHLAPVAGDVCVPLVEEGVDDPFAAVPTAFLADLDDFMLSGVDGTGENLGPLLAGEELGDPFMAYRDLRPDDGAPSPHLLSPNVSKSSDCSLPSLNSPSDSLLDEDQMSTFMNLQMEDDAETVKAPFIHMNLTDDLPLLTDIMWNSNDRSKNQTLDSNSNLAQLLSTSINKHSLKSNDHGGGLLQEQNEIENLYNKKNLEKNWNNSRVRSQSDKTTSRTSSLKRTCTSGLYDQHSIKKSRNEPKEKMSAELLTQLMSNNQHRGRPKGKSNWLLDSGLQKAACVSQPSESVLMNLLNHKNFPPADMETDNQVTPQEAMMNDIAQKKLNYRKNSFSLLDPESNGIASLLNLNQQDYEVNAPVNSLLLQGEELLHALEVPNSM